MGGRSPGSTISPLVSGPARSRQGSTGRIEGRIAGVFDVEAMHVRSCGPLALDSAGSFTVPSSEG